jgi:hypothetical protein
MSSSAIQIPRYPRADFKRFPSINDLRSADTLQLVASCNSVLEQFTDAVKACDPQVHAQLLGGTRSDRFGALRTAFSKAARMYRQQVEKYFIELEAARMAAIDSPIVQYMSREIQENLTVKAEPMMSHEVRHQLVTALWAVKHLERETEREDRNQNHSSNGNGGHSQSAARKRAKSKQDKDIRSRMRGGQRVRS